MALEGKSLVFAQRVGSNIRAERSRRNLSQDELAQKVGVSPASITNWENGTNAIALDNACKFADFFGITLDELCGRKMTA